MGLASVAGGGYFVIGAIVLLLVEDEPLILMAAQEALEAGGFTVVPAASGTEALVVLNSRHTEIAGVITDVRLGSGPDGWEVSRHARELKPDFPVIYVTGDSAADWPVNGVPNSILLQKPYAAAQILTAISSVLIGATG
jgi:CheY-like chemotaxis protein